MKVRDLIKMLERCPQNMPVCLAYDSLVCRDDVRARSSFIVYKQSGYCEPGVYLCSMEPNEVSWHMKKEGAQRIPRQKGSKE